MSRRARWGLLLSCCGLAALVAPSAWEVLDAGSTGASALGADPLAKLQERPRSTETAGPVPRSERRLEGAAVASTEASAEPGSAASKRSVGRRRPLPEMAPARVAR